VARRGRYPYRCRIRTPAGEIAPTLYSPDDMITVNEVFCVGVYPVPPDASVIVDFGANIGISALYFLTEARHSRVHLFEPNPRLSERLRDNLTGFADRVAISEVAVSTHDGATSFGVEPTGRYGGIGVPWASELIEVPSRSADSVLRQILRDDGRIDVLKIDVEATEVEILRSLAPDVVNSIGMIHVETGFGDNPLGDLCTMHRQGVISTLTPKSRAI
jgi:FkbM family methyltransferase